MPVEHAVEVMLPVLDALHFAHCLTRGDGTPLGIVHRDISPANILIDHLGNVKLHDFGIARMADDEFKTQDGTFRGTLSFTAPETLQGVAASPRSDLYACGVLLYQLIAGSNPFRGQQPSETLHRVVTYVPPGLASLRDEVGQALEAAVARAMEKDPEKRFDSAASFAEALRAARTWDEASALADLQYTLHEDFTGPLPEVLGLENLQSRDAAWRAVSGPRSALSSSPPPPPRRSSGPITQTAQVPVTPHADPMATIQALPSSALLELARAGGASLAAQGGEATIVAPPVAPAVAPPSPRKGRRWIAAAVVVGVVLAAGAAYPLLQKPAPPPPPRFLLIEKQAEAPPEPGSAEPARSADVTTPAAPGGGAAGAAALPKLAKAADSPSSGNSITAAFQRQRGRVEACFRASASDGSSQPQVTIRFQVEASGAVKSADLIPASLNGSPLGACILGVARSTRFPAGEAPVSFTIPITARKTGG